MIPPVGEILGRETVSQYFKYSMAGLSGGFFLCTALAHTVSRIKGYNNNHNDAPVDSTSDNPISQKIRVSERQMSWILTCIASLVMTIAGSVSNYEFYMRSGLDLSIHPTSMSKLDEMFVVFFVSYLVLDLALGSVFYRSQITLLSGWIHHSLYAYLMIWLLYYNLCTPFILMTILELPTFILSIGHLSKPLRNDVLFGSTYFLTRILYHAFMIWNFYERFPLQGWWLVVASAFPLHCYWFSKFVKQQKRLKKMRGNREECVNGDFNAQYEGIVCYSKPSDLQVLKSSDGTINKEE